MMTTNAAKTRKPILLLSTILVAALVLPLQHVQADDNDTESIDILRKVGKAF